MIEADVAPGIYHAVNAGAATWYEFAKEIMTQAKMNADVIPITSGAFPTRARRPVYSVLDHTKISAAIGSQRHWREALAHYLREKEFLR